MGEDKDKYSIIGEMMDYINNNDMYYIVDLWDYAKKEHADDWLPILKNRQANTVLKLYLSSYRDSVRKDKGRVPPPANSWHNIGSRQKNENKLYET